MKKTHILISVFILITTLILYFTNSIYYKFIYEIIKLNKSLPTISSNFYDSPIENITYKDVIYKNRNDLKLKLDIYKSKNNNKKSPVIIYVFGNGWIDGSKVIPSGISPIVNLLLEEGYTIISTSYELMNDKIIFDNQVSDIKDTIRWVYKFKDKYDFDTNNIGIIAPSAGAQLSMLAAFSDNNDFIGDYNLSGYPSKVKYIIDLFGPTILSEVNLSEAPKEITNNLSADDINKISNKYSPINYLRDNLPDTLIIHSLSDSIVPYRTSIELYNKANSYNNNNFQFYTL